MTILDLLKLVEKYAKSYKDNGVAKSIVRNSHMNEFEGDEGDIDEKLVDAILVDFINFIARNQGVDYGMYTKDLQEERIIDKGVVKFDS